MMSKKVAVVAFRCTVIQLFGAKNEKIAVPSGRLSRGQSGGENGEGRPVLASASIAISYHSVRT